MTGYLSTRTLDEVLSRDHASLAGDLKGRIQEAFTSMQTGVEVVDVSLPLIRPAGDTVRQFEDLAMAAQDLERLKSRAEQSRLTTLAYLVGDPGLAGPLVEGIEKFESLEKELGSDDPKVLEQRDLVERLLRDSGGRAGLQISEAYANRWIALLSERANAVRFGGQLAAYRAAPELYMQREIMQVYKQRLSKQRSFILGIDPARVNLDVELKELSPMFDIESSISPEGEQQ